MTQIELAYGRSAFEFSFDEARFSVVHTTGIPESPLKDFEIGVALDDRSTTGQRL